MLGDERAVGELRHRAHIIGEGQPERGDMRPQRVIGALDIWLEIGIFGLDAWSG